MSRSALLGLMALIEGGAGLLVLLLPGGARRQFLSELLPSLTNAGLQVAGGILIAVGGMCLFGWLRAPRPSFPVMLADNALAAAGLTAIGLLGDTAGPLFWPAVLVHAALVGLQVRAMLSD